MPAGNEVRQKRQRAIMTILRQRHVSRQEELVELLQDRGIEATQSSISRDLRQLGISKLDQEYQKLDQPEPGVDRDLALLADFVGEIRPAGPNLTVVRTAEGAAQRVAVFLDRSGWPEIVGTVSGDDTIFVATRNAAEQRRLLVRLRARFGRAPEEARPEARRRA